jgi:hypothetical protein
MFALACCRRVDGLLTQATMPSPYTPGVYVDPREALPLAEKLVEGELPPTPWPVNRTFYLARAVSATDRAMAAACHAAADFFHENRRALRRTEPFGTVFERQRVRGRTLVGVLTSYETRLAVARAAAGPASPDGGEKRHAAWQDAERAEAAAHAVLVRCLFRNPFVAAPTLERRRLAPDGGAVSRLAATIYAGHTFDRLPFLADALEDAGCTDDNLLGHLRGPGPHVRGCWAVDLVLGKR